MQTKTLLRIPVFQGLRAARLGALIRDAETRRYKRGQTIFQQGERADAVWVVVKGWVHLVRCPSPQDGAHAVVLYTITPREVLCGVSALEPGRYTASGVAGTDSTVVRIPGADFVAALRQEPELAFRVLQLYAQRIRLMAEHLGGMVEPVPKRITRSILRLYRQFGATVLVTHRELAQMSWTTTESAIRVVRRLKRRGFVSGTRGRLTIKQPAAMQEWQKSGNDHLP